ncbi:hypothetical protein EYF80_048240 [Liparis tanakae]|uniref:Uncharacterized protein n=1 Tax=Liparis tanakae TaxID=230148 RepID=A0A4Z2FK32_9TELE|nr:hypothetical protein EYF80_048240 [Liparis tanakae]
MMTRRAEPTARPEATIGPGPVHAAGRSPSHRETHGTLVVWTLFHCYPSGYVMLSKTAGSAATNGAGNLGCERGKDAIREG